MNKTNLTTIILLLTLSIVCKGQTKKPNIVWIVTEDNSAHWLKLYNNNGASMPNVERLAKNGIVFNNAFSNAPVCSAARSTLISGCYDPRVGTQYHRKFKKAPMPEGLEFYPVYLQKAGYYAANNSKKDYNLEGNTGWNASSSKASYRNRAEGQPFFQIWNLGQTHEGKIHFPKSDVKNVKTLTSPDSIEVFPYHPNTPLFRYSYARYLDLHMQVDKVIGEKLALLEEDGLMDDTIIFYYGDNGGILPRSKGYAYDNGTHIPLVVYFPEKYKHLMPAPKNSRVDGFVSFVDFAPTLLNLIGIDVPKQMDGIPFLGENIELKELNSRDEVFVHADRLDEKYDLVRTIRKGNFEYIRNYQPFNIDGLYNNYRYKQASFREWYHLYKEGKLNAAQSQFFEPRTPEMLFDLSEDPHEVNNLAQLPEYEEKLQQMRVLMNKKVKSLPDLSFYPEPYLVEKAFDNPVKFGQEHQSEIAELVDIANLNYIGFEQAKRKIKKALNSDNPWKRYWGLIVCSSYGNEASPFFSQAKKIAENDKETLVRVRAAEFLGLTGNENPVLVIEEALTQSKSKIEAVLILNSASLLKMQNPTLNFNLKKELFPKEWTQGKGNWINNHIAFSQGNGQIN